MSRFKSRGAALLASFAVFSMTASPVLARDWGWGGGHYRHRDRVDAGDIFAGLLIIGGIAAIASAASKSSKSSGPRPEPRYPDQDYRRDDRSGSYAGDDRPQWNDGPQANDGSASINMAINRCMDEIDRGKTRVESVDSVGREGSGWRVQGRVDGDSDFTCTIDGEGRIRQVSIDGHAV